MIFKISIKYDEETDLSKIAEWLLNHIGRQFKNQDFYSDIEMIETFKKSDSDWYGFIKFKKQQCDFYFKDSEKAMLFKLVWA